MDCGSVEIWRIGSSSADAAFSESYSFPITVLSVVEFVERIDRVRMHEPQSHLNELVMTMLYAKLECEVLAGIFC